MLALSNPFYQNPEANARQLLQEQMLAEAQRGVQQCLAELFAFRSLFSQGQLCLCIPLQPFPFAPIPPAHFQGEQPCPVPQIQKTKETKLFLSLGSDHPKKVSALQSDECKLKVDCVEIVVDLREVLPGEIFVGIEERMVGVEVNRFDGLGMKNLWRRYDLPSCVQTEAAKCILSHDGFLHISVPWCKMEM